MSEDAKPGTNPGDDLLAPGAIRTREDFERFQQTQTRIPNIVHEVVSTSVDDDGIKVRSNFQLSSGLEEPEKREAVVPSEDEVSVRCGPRVIPDGEKIIPLPGSADRRQEPKELEMAPASDLANVPTKALARELVNRIIEWMNKK